MRTTPKNRESRLVRNEYARMKIEQKYELDMIDECRDHPKLFHRFINKMKHKESIIQLRDKNGMYEEPKETVFID